MHHLTLSEATPGVDSLFSNASSVIHPSKVTFSFGGFLLENEFDLLNNLIESVSETDYLNRKKLFLNSKSKLWLNRIIQINHTLIFSS
jgi:hypothetical protein